MLGDDGTLARNPLYSDCLRHALQDGRHAVLSCLDTQPGQFALRLSGQSLAGSEIYYASYLHQWGRFYSDVKQQEELIVHANASLARVDGWLLYAAYDLNLASLNSTLKAEYYP